MLKNQAYTPEILPLPLAIESANSLRFLWTALSIEGAALSIEGAVLSIEGVALSIESTPFYRMVGFLGIPRNAVLSIESANS